MRRRLSTKQSGAARLCRSMTRHAIVMLQMASHQPNPLPQRGFAELDGDCGGDGHVPDGTDLDARGYPANDRRSAARAASTNPHAHAGSRFCGVGARLCTSVSTPRTSCEYSEYHVSTQGSRFGPLGALVRSAPAQSSHPADSIRGLVVRRGVRRGRGKFAGDSSVPSHQAHGAPPGQGALHRTHATRQRQNNNPPPRQRVAPRTGGARAWHGGHAGV